MFGVRNLHDARGKRFVSETHRVSHVSSRLDDDGAFFLVATLHQSIVDNHLFLEVGPLSVSEFGEFEDIATRHLVEVEKLLADVVDVDTFHLVEHAAHFVRDDSRTCCNTVE